MIYNVGMKRWCDFSDANNTSIIPIITVRLGCSICGCREVFGDIFVIEPCMVRVGWLLVSN